MLPGGNESEHTPPTRATRLRLVALGPLEISRGLSCVQVEAEHRTNVAATIAQSIIGPRPSGVDGTIEIVGRYVSLQSLPEPLLRPSATAIVDRAYLDTLWREACARERTDLAAAHAARRLDRHRTEAAIERARQRATVAATPVAAPRSAPAGVPDEVTPELERLLAAASELRPVPSPDALALADEFDALAVEPSAPAPVDIDLTALERHVHAARREVAQVSGGVLLDARRRIEAAHRNVVDTEREVYEAGRKEKAVVTNGYQSALAELNDALQEAGFES